jgi:hypothetical protein
MLLQLFGILMYWTHATPYNTAYNTHAHIHAYTHAMLVWYQHVTAI